MNENGKKLDQYCHIVSGGTPSRKRPEFYGGDILWATIADMEKSDGIVIDTKEKITQEGLASIRNRLFTKGTLLLAMYGSVGKVAIAGKEMATNQAILGITPKNEREIYIPYLKYWLMTNRKKIINKSRGGILKNLSAKIVKNIKINLPLYDDQIKIVNLLTQVETLIAKRKESIKLLDELLKSTFLDMFGDPVTNPQKRQTVRFDEVVVLQRGFDLPKSKRNRDGKIPLYGSNGIVDYHSEAKLNEGIITGRSGTIGKVYYSDVPFWPLNTTLFSKDLKGNNIIYLAYLLSLFRLERFHQGAGVPTLNRNNVHKEKIYKVDRKEQDKFATIVQQVEETKKHYQKSLDELNQFFGSLSQRAFKGELDLSKMELTNLDEPDDSSNKSESIITKDKLETFRNSAKNVFEINKLKAVAEQGETIRKLSTIGDAVKRASMLAQSFKPYNIPILNIEIPKFYKNIISFDFNSITSFNTIEELQHRIKLIYQMLEDIPQIKDGMKSGVLSKDDFLELPLRHDYEYSQIKRIIMNKLSSGELSQHFDENSKKIKLVKPA